MTSCVISLRSRVVGRVNLAAQDLDPEGTTGEKDEYQKKLEARIPYDLKPFTSVLADPDLHAKMRGIVEGKSKFARSCVIVTIAANTDDSGRGTMTIECPRPLRKGDREETRREAYVKMLEDLDKWSAAHDLPLPVVSFIIYVTDTYMWEPYASGYPWLTMAKPCNRNGILIPDNSFITHGPAGSETEGWREREEWAWTPVVQTLSSVAAESTSWEEKEPVAFFKGAETGADKYATRTYLASIDVPVQVDLSGTKEPMAAWATKKVLLDLPGHQPWSYRRKYLYLLGSPTVHVDVCVDYGNGEVTDKWELFFDHLFRSGTCYVKLVQHYFDEDNPSALKGNPYMLKRLRTQVREAYSAIEARGTSEIQKMVDRSSAIIQALTRDRILRYFHTVLHSYASMTASVSPAP